MYWILILYCLFFVTCVITASIFNIFALFLFYQCKLYCAAFFYSCILCVIFVLSLMSEWCFNFGLFHIQLPVDRCWICETYIYVSVPFWTSCLILQHENSSQRNWSACKLLCSKENCSTHTESKPIVPPCLFSTVFGVSGIPRNFVQGEFNKFSWGQRAERMGMWRR